MAMEIYFNIGKTGKARLTSDASQYVIAIQGTTKEGKPGIWKTAAYLSSPESALSRILELNIRASEATTLLELRDDLLRAKQEVLTQWSTGITL
jgi:hypothetical protein